MYLYSAQYLHILQDSKRYLTNLRIRFLNQRRPRIDLKNTLTKGMRLNRGLPPINTMMNPMNLGFHHLLSKNMLTRVDIRSFPDTCHLPQRRSSPLQPDTGLQSPLRLSPLGLSLTKTNLNMIQTPLIIGK